MFPRSSWIKRQQGCGVGGRFQREGTYMYLWLIHVVWQKPTQHCKATIFQLKKKKSLKKKKRKKDFLQANSSTEPYEFS